MILSSLTLLATLLATLVEALVDNSSPDISGFKLRHVDLEAEAKLRAEKPIESLWEGAILMKEALFVDANYVKCPAYAHLFKLIKHQNEQVSKLSSSKANSSSAPKEALNGNVNSKLVKQSVIQSLAIVATYDRLFYHKLMERSLPISIEHFLEATLGLEDNKKEQKWQEAWLDMLACLKEFSLIRVDKVVEDFLSEPGRAKELMMMSKFMSIPVELEKAPSGLVSNLVKRFDNNDIVVDPNMYETARVVVLGFDDEETAKQRIEWGAEQVIDNMEKPMVILSSSEQETLSNPEMALKPDEEELKNLRIAEDIEIAVPQKDPPPASSLSNINNSEKSPASNGDNSSDESNNNQKKEDISLDHLAILKFIKMRLESKQKTPRLSMRLVFDFKGHFEKLLKVNLKDNLDENPINKEAELFRRDKRNLELYARCDKIIDEYLKIIHVLAEIKTLNDRLESLDEFGKPLEKLNELLKNFDSSFDLDDIRRLQAIWKLKYREYITIQKFIDNDGSR